MGSYVRVLAVLALESDLNGLAADDRVGRKLQDLALEPARKGERGRRSNRMPTDSASQSPPRVLKKDSST
jgi:hypothetical protein